MIFSSPFFYRFFVVVALLSSPSPPLLLCRLSFLFVSLTSSQASIILPVRVETNVIRRIDKWIQIFGPFQTSDSGESLVRHLLAFVYLSIHDIYEYFAIQWILFFWIFGRNVQLTVHESSGNGQLQLKRNISTRRIYLSRKKTSCAISFAFVDVLRFEQLFNVYREWRSWRKKNNVK